MITLTQAKAKLRSFTTETSGGSIHARTNREPPPDAPTIILIHGFIVSSRYMLPLAGLLVEGYRVFAPDLPGYGKSHKPKHALPVSGLADVLGEWMEVMGIERAHLLANSYGCQIIADFAARFPEKVSRLVLAGPTVDPRARNGAVQGAKLWVNKFMEPTKLGPIMMTDYAASGLRIIRETYHNCLHDRIEQKLPLIEAPTLIVRGGRDLVVPQRWAEEATRLCPRGRLKVIPGYGHAVNFTAPLELSRVIEPFISGQEDFIPKSRSAAA